MPLTTWHGSPCPSRMAPWKRRSPRLDLAQPFSEMAMARLPPSLGCGIPNPGGTISPMKQLIFGVLLYGKNGYPWPPFCLEVTPWWVETKLWMGWLTCLPPGGDAEPLYFSSKTASLPGVLKRIGYRQSRCLAPPLGETLLLSRAGLVV